MKRTAFCLLMSLTLLFLTGCRENLMNLQNSNDGTLSVSVQVSRSLYQGEYLTDGDGRFVGPTSKSISLSYSVGDQEYSTAMELELTTDGGSLTGTATLTGLPVGVQGVVNVSTFNGTGQILCDGEEVLVLASGENQVTLTLSISDLCPFLEIKDLAEYAFGIIAPGGVFFLKIENMTGGDVYEMQVYQEVETLDSPEIAVITGDGDRISFQELVSDTGGISFTLPDGADSAVICFYNPYSYEIPGLLWVDNPVQFTNLILESKIDTSTLSMNALADQIRMDAGSGYLVLSEQGVSYTNTDLTIDDGRFLYTQDNTNWNSRYLVADGISGNTELYNSVITDINLQSNLVTLPIYKGDFSDLEDRYGKTVFNLTSDSIDSNYNEWGSFTDLDFAVSNSNPPMENMRFAISETVEFICFKPPYEDKLEIIYKIIGSSTAIRKTISNVTSSTTTYDELQTVAVGEDLYILADSILYRYTAGASSLDSIFTLANSTIENFRYLNLFKDKYIIASNGSNSYLYIPEYNMTQILLDSNNIDPDLDAYLQTLDGPGVKMISAASNNIFSNLIIIEESNYPVGLVVNISENGGYTLSSEIFLTSADLPANDFQIRQVCIDEYSRKVYIGLIEQPAVAADFYSIMVFSYN